MQLHVLVIEGVPFVSPDRAASARCNRNSHFVLVTSSEPSLITRTRNRIEQSINGHIFMIAVDCGQPAKALSDVAVFASSV
jgi:hypothetical protein